MVPETPQTDCSKPLFNKALKCHRPGHIKKERERERAMKTNTIQIIRILCLRPASMPSRDFPAGIRAQPDPKRRNGLRQRRPRQALPSPLSACPWVL